MGIHNYLQNLTYRLGVYAKSLFLVGLFFYAGNAYSQVKLVNHNRLNTPQIIQFTAVSEQPSFEQWQPIVKKMVGYGGNSQWKIYSELTDAQLESHYRIQHYFQGFPVRSSVGVVHVNSGRIRMINGDFVPENRLKGSVVLDKDAAREIALKRLPAKKYNWKEEGNNA